jgi:hypothetical protein
LCGPALLSNLVSVLLRSRQFKYAISADIEGMYHRISMNPKDQSVFRVVSFKPGSGEQITLKKTTQVFGAITFPTSAFWVV